MLICFNTLLLFIFVLSPIISIPTPEVTVSETSARIVNGFEVDITEVPYQAALRRRVLTGWAHTCGAVIITVRALLTAAHCVQDYTVDPSLLRVVVGTSFRLSGGKIYDLSQVIMHESYSSITLEHDIGMLVTKSKINFSQSVNAVSFASENFYIPAGTRAIVSGFGTVSYEGSSSSVLLAAYVYIVDQRTCGNAYRYIGTVSSGMICANASDPQRDACRGDSGGPLVAYNNVIGIVSWGEGCAEPMYPGVYTRVSEYSAWIRQKLAQIY